MTLADTTTREVNFNGATYRFFYHCRVIGIGFIRTRCILFFICISILLPANATAQFSMHLHGIRVKNRNNGVDQILHDTENEVRYLHVKRISQTRINYFARIGAGLNISIYHKVSHSIGYTVDVGLTCQVPVLSDYGITPLVGGFGFGRWYFDGYTDTGVGLEAGFIMPISPKVRIIGVYTTDRIFILGTDFSL